MSDCCHLCREPDTATDLVCCAVCGQSVCYECCGWCGLEYDDACGDWFCDECIEAADAAEGE